LQKGYLKMGTHPEITNKRLRAIFANELLVLRRAMKQASQPIGSDWVSGIRLGFETALRRVENSGIATGAK
jgi:hypothetical protein